MSIIRFLFIVVTLHVAAIAVWAQDGRVQAKSAQRSGVAELRVWDRKTKQFIYAGLSIYPIKVRHKTWYAMSVDTRDDGSSIMVTLLPGTYAVKVDRYLCNGKRYFSHRPRSTAFVVRAGRTRKKTLTIDVSKIRNARSYDNVGGEPCRLNSKENENIFLEKAAI